MEFSWLTSAPQGRSRGRFGSSHSGAGIPTIGAIEALETRSLLTLVVVPIGATATIQFQGRVGSFAAGDVTGNIADLKAQISWGDETTSDGQITANSSGGFDIAGAHSYAKAGTYTFSILLTGTNSTAATAFGPASVSSPALIVSGTTIKPTASVPFKGTVASFVAGPASSEADFIASIDWGDSQTSPGTIVATGGGGYNVVGSHTYASATPNMTSDSIKVTIQQLLSDQPAVVAASTAFVQTGITAVGTTIAPTAGILFTGAVASFTSVAPVAPGNFAVTIDWGDSQTSPGTVVANGGGYDVIGSHTFAKIGSQTIKTSIQDVSQSSGGGETVVTVNATSVAVVGLQQFSGRLSELSDTGTSNSDGITKVNQPKFSGSAQPYSLVQIYSQRPGQRATVLQGQTIANADGAWNVTVGPLADGVYTITATVTPSAGNPITNVALSPITIDTVAPRVTGVNYDAKAGNVRVVFRDNLSGMDRSVGQNVNPGSIAFPSNYNLIGRVQRRLASPNQPRLITTQIITSDPQAVAVTLEKPLWSLRKLRVLSGGVTDIAGNALYGNGPNGGNFVISLKSSLASRRLGTGANPDNIRRSLHQSS